MIKDMKMKMAQMQIVDDAFTKHGINGKFIGDEISVKIEDMVKLIIELRGEKR